MNIKEVNNISIIVPVYNVENYLKRCIDSILRQTYTHFYLVLVDDGSLDQSGRICDDYSSKDSRIHVIHQSNAGLSAARNTGIEWAIKNSSCEWLSFIDSDDWVHPMYLELLLQAARTKGTAIAIGEALWTYGEPLPIIEQSVPVVWETDEYYLKNTVNATVAWGKLYKKSCFHNIRFPEGKIHEDEYVVYKVLFKQKTVAVVEEPLYAYFQNDLGITRRKWTPVRLDAIPALEQQVIFFEQRGNVEITQKRFNSLVNNIERNRRSIIESELGNIEKQYYITQLNHRLRRILIRYRKYGWLPFWGSNRNKTIYSNAFISIRVGRFVWGKVKSLLKWFPITSIIGKQIKRDWRKHK